MMKKTDAYVRPGQLENAIKASFETGDEVF